jgi:hypothetical protein
MKPDALNAANAKEREAVLVLQAAELALDRCAAAVQVAPLRVPRLIGVSG